MTPRGWLQARSGRERAMLAAALGLGATYVMQSQVVRPVLAWRATAQAEIARIDAVRQALGQAAPSPSGPRDTPAARVVTDSAAPFGLTIRRLEAEGSATRVVLDEAPFDALVGWLQALEHQHGLQVTQIALDRRPAPGLVAAQITLAQRGGR